MIVGDCESGTICNGHIWTRRGCACCRAANPAVFAVGIGNTLKVSDEW